MADINPQAVCVRAASRLHTDAAVSDAQLRRAVQQQHGVDGRRLSRLSLLALAGALDTAGRTAAPDAVYMGAVFASAALMRRMFDHVLSEGVAKPFDFLANLHNAPVFHVAAALGCHGQTLVLPVTGQAASWSIPLRLALNDMAIGAIDSALVGWCYEHQPHCGETRDGSHWLRLQRTPSADAPQLWLAADGEDAVSPPVAQVPNGADEYHAVANWLDGLGMAGEHRLPLDGRCVLVCRGVAGFAVRRPEIA